MKSLNIALLGNPNVGKSTLFNKLTGLTQHTGNWSGKTVDLALGNFKYKHIVYALADLPGTYSLISSSAEESIAEKYILTEEFDLIILIADATTLKRNLNLIMQAKHLTNNLIICLNLMDEAKKKNIHIDSQKLSSFLETPVIPISARTGDGIHLLLEEIHHFAENLYSDIIEDEQPLSRENFEVIPCYSLKTPSLESAKLFAKNNSFENFNVGENVANANIIYDACVNCVKKNFINKDLKVDKFITSKFFALPTMLLLMSLVFWITISAANYPSLWLSNLFSILEEKLRSLFLNIHMFPYLESLLFDGIYKTLTWVIAVMLPPIAIFFPLFSILEDLGYLPRVAFNMDHIFHKCHSCGKQCLTMLMGFGCNACGVVGCRIIESRREKLIAIITNSLIPCNGRFPTLIAFISIFFTVGVCSSLKASLILTLFILLSIIMTFLTSAILSKTLLKGVTSSFVLELPPYRKPDFLKVILNSFVDKVIFVLSKSIIIAAPAGIVIWIMANFKIENLSMLSIFSDFFNPFGQLLGVDGVIILALILSFPANEIFIPVLLMAYMSQGSLVEYENLLQLKELLISNGWNQTTALCTMVLCLFHFPCGTTCLTIYKECNSLKWTLISIILPATCGIAMCLLIRLFSILLN